MCAKMSSFSPDSLLLPHRVWKVKFVGKRILCFVASLSQLFFYLSFSGFSFIFEGSEERNGYIKTACWHRNVLKMLGNNEAF